MEDKKKFNWLIPAPICEALEPAYESVNDKQKWLVGSAALMMFLEASEEEQKAMIRKIAGADATGTVQDLIDQIPSASDPIPLSTPPAKAARTKKKPPSGRKKKS